MLTTIYLLLALILTSIIYLKTQKISKLSTHQGIKLINKSFLFLSLAYLIQILITTSTLPFSKLSIIQALAHPVTSYLFTISALFLATSFFWKNHKQHLTQLHSLAILTAILNILTSILPLALTAIYSITAIKTYENYKTKSTIFSQSLLIAISLLAASNFIAFLAHTSLTSQLMSLVAYTIFLYGTLKSTSN